MEEFIAGGVAGCCGLLVGYPLDVAKVQQQIIIKKHSRQITNIIKKMTDKGVSNGYFRGLSFPLLSYTGTNSIFFGSYSHTLNYLEKVNEENFYRNVTIAGMVGGAAQLPVVNVVETVKTVMQSQVTQTGGNRYFKGPIDCMKHVVNLYGVRRLNRAFGVTFLRDVPSFGLYMLIYEWMIRNISWKSVSVRTILSGGLAGVACWGCIIPLDVIKSRMQADIAKTKYTTGLQTARLVYKEGGLPAFFRGTSMIIARAFPVNIAIFGSWAFARKCFNYVNNEPNETL